MSTHTAMELIRKMRKPDNKSVLQAVEALRARRLLNGDTLEGAFLRFVHLQGADLHSVSLQGADLTMADLRETDLSLVNLQGAKLCRANLCRANLSATNIEDADLHKADLYRAHNLTDEQLSQARRLRGARMPDGRLYDGRFNLAGDIAFAQTGGNNTEDEEEMATFYGVSVEAYSLGQQWAQEWSPILKQRIAKIKWDVIHRDLPRAA